MDGEVEMAMMVQPVPLAQTPAGPAWRISVRIDDALINSGASPENCLLSGRIARGATDDQLETQLLIEMRYQQHLAEQALQDLFESGEFGSPGDAR
jgi:hypothetical protein